MNAEIANKVFDSLIAHGFMGGFDCATAPVHGVYERGKRAGQQRRKDDEWWVKVTPVDDDAVERLRAALRPFEWTAEGVSFEGGTYTFTGPSWGFKVEARA